MDAGWAWQIEHEQHVNRGYVYSSQAISDDDARAEFLRKNPKAPADARVVKFVRFNPVLFEHAPRCFFGALSRPRPDSDVSLGKPEHRCPV